MGNRINIALRSAFGMLDDTWRASGVTVRTNEHGYESCSVHVPGALREATDLFTRPGSLRHEVCSGGLHLFDGRLEDIHLTGDGVDLQSFGDWAYMLDNTYSAVWSTTVLKPWYAPTSTQVADSRPDLFTFANNGTQLSINAIIGQNYGGTSGSPVGRWNYDIPSGSGKNIAGALFDFVVVTFNTATTWSGLLQLLDANGTATATPWQVTPTASSSKAGAAFVTFTGSPRLSFALYNPNAASTTLNGGGGAGNGVTQLRISNLRLVADTTYQINTTITVTSGNTNASVGSSAGMYVGQRLVIANGTVPNESIVVASITNATQIVTTAPVTFTWSGATLKGVMIYADQVAADLVNGAQGIRAWNPGCVSAATTLIQSPGVDMVETIYEDQSHGDVLDRLCFLGDTQTPPRRWEAGFYEGRNLFFRPQLSTATHAWYVDETEIDVDRSITALYNNVYATYQDASGVTVRGGYAQNNNSISRYGVERTKVIQPQSTSAAEVAVETAATLQDTKDVTPRSKIVTKRVYDAAGGLWPLWCVRAGDTVTIRQYPAKLGTEVDEVRTFRIARTEYDVDNDKLTLEPGTAPASLDVLLAREVVNTTLKK